MVYDLSALRQEKIREATRYQRWAAHATQMAIYNRDVLNRRLVAIYWQSKAAEYFCLARLALSHLNLRG